MVQCIWCSTWNNFMFHDFYASEAASDRRYRACAAIYNFLTGNRGSSGKYTRTGRRRWWFFRNYEFSRWKEFLSMWNLCLVRKTCSRARYPRYGKGEWQGQGKRAGRLLRPCRSRSAEKFWFCERCDCCWVRLLLIWCVPWSLWKVLP